MKNLCVLNIDIVMDKDDDLYKRIEKLAQESGRSIQNIVELMEYDGLYGRMMMRLPLVERTLKQYGKDRADGGDH